MNLKANILVRGPADLTVVWAQRIVSHHSADARVSRVSVHSVDVGTTTRLRVDVEHDAADALPTRWFVKAPSLALQARIITALPGLLHKEVNFYRELSRSVPLQLPPVLAAQSKTGRGSTLVLADIAELGSRPGHPSDALTADQAGQVVEHLARFHAHYWNRPDLAASHRWLGGHRLHVEDFLGTLMAVPLMKRGLYCAGEAVPASLHAPALRYAGNRRQWMRALAQGPQTLVHHDCHPGNLFWTQSQPGFLDWQLVRQGEGIGDIAYFLSTALEPDCRRRHEQELLELYLCSLARHGVHGLDKDHLWQRYRAHLVYPLEAMIVTLAIGGMMGRDSNMELIRRTAAAAEDHGAFSALAISPNIAGPWRTFP